MADKFRKIIEETSTLKYGDARYTNIELNAPKQIGANKYYTVTLKVDAPKDSVVIASINKENIVYPQTKSDDAFRKMPDDNILERVFLSNKNNVNEYAVASVGITRAENYSDNQIRVYMGGLAFIMTRINVVPENKYIKVDNNTGNNKNGKTSKFIYFVICYVFFIFTDLYLSNIMVEKLTEGYKLSNPVFPSII